jgi:DNA-binding response OmpR family regulator
MGLAMVKSLEMKILIVDDDFGLRSMLSTLMARAGHQVTVAKNGDKGLECFSLARTPFDLVITDHSMPAMSGSEFVRSLRAVSDAVKIIVFSAQVSAEDKRRYRELDVEVIFTKQVGFKEMVEMLNGMAQRPVKSQAWN